MIRAFTFLAMGYKGRDEVPVAKEYSQWLSEDWTTGCDNILVFTAVENSFFSLAWGRRLLNFDINTFLLGWGRCWQMTNLIYWFCTFFYFDDGGELMCIIIIIIISSVFLCVFVFSRDTSLIWFFPVFLVGVILFWAQISHLRPSASTLTTNQVSKKFQLIV